MHSAISAVVTPARGCLYLDGSLIVTRFGRRPVTFAYDVMSSCSADELSGEAVADDLTGEAVTVTDDRAGEAVADDGAGEVGADIRPGETGTVDRAGETGAVGVGEFQIIPNKGGVGSG